ncbi:MAG: hypothetical protein HYY22_04235 [Thaumarchaeota archaeon]|nr:hypothetical protein [Nitrososphaerota archaeon]
MHDALEGSYAGRGITKTMKPRAIRLVLLLAVVGGIIVASSLFVLGVGVFPPFTQIIESGAPTIVRVSDRNYLRTDLPVFDRSAENYSLANQVVGLSTSNRQRYIETAVKRAETLGLDETNLRDILTKLMFHIDELNFTDKNTFTDNDGKIFEISFRISNTTVQIPYLIEKVKYNGVDAWIIALNWENKESSQGKWGHVAAVVVKYGSDEVLFAKSCM